MDPIGIVAIVGILVVAGCFGYLYRRDIHRYNAKMSKSPSQEGLNTMAQTEDPA